MSPMPKEIILSALSGFARRSAAAAADLGEKVAALEFREVRVPGDVEGFRRNASARTTFMAARPAYDAALCPLAGFSLKKSAAVASPMVSRRQRRGLPVPDARCLDAQLRVRCCKLLQLSHGSATSSNDGCVVIIMNGRVSAGMVANALRFTVCSCKSPTEMLALSLGSTSGRIVSGNDRRKRD